MATAQQIKELADNLLKASSTNEPSVIAEDLGVRVYYRDDFDELLGLYARLNDIGCIFINEALEPGLKRLVLAHELGHDQLHKEFANGGMLKDFSLYSVDGRLEYEANAFAAQLLIEDEQVVYHLSQGYTLNELAGILEVDLNLLTIKINEMKKLGLKVHSFDLPKSNFLKMQN